MSVLKIENVSKSFRGVQALSQVSITLEAGRIYGFVGNNGAGKTTLFRILAGLVTPDEGKISLFGQSGERELRKARRRMGFLLPKESFSMDMTALNNLVALQKLRGYQDKKEALKLLELLGIDGEKAMRWKLASFSSGQFQRVALAACLLESPDLLLMDEPQTGLDPSMVQELRQLLIDQKERGKTVFLSSHNLAELHQLATDYIFIHHGNIIKTMTQETLDEQAEGDLERYFLRLVGEEVS